MTKGSESNPAVNRLCLSVAVEICWRTRLGWGIKVRLARSRRGAWLPVFQEVNVTMDECGSSSLNVAESAGEDPDPCSTRLAELRGTSLTAGGEMV